MTCFQRVQYEKGNNSTFIVQKPGKYYLDQVMDVNITSNVMWVSRSPYYVTKELYLCGILSKKPITLVYPKINIRQILISGHSTGHLASISQDC